MSASRYEFDSVVRGFHEYQSIWAPVLGEGLPCKREIHNPHDSFAVAVTKDRMVIGHLPRRFLVSRASRFYGGVNECFYSRPHKNGWLARLGGSRRYFGRFCEVARSLAL